MIIRSKNNKLNKFVVGMAILMALLVLSIIFMGNNNSIAYAENFDHIYVDYDGSYHVFLNDTEIKTLSAIDLDTKAKQQSFIDELNIAYPNNIFALRKGFGDVVNDNDKYTLDYGNTINLKVNFNEALVGYITNEASFNWYYSKSGQEYIKLKNNQSGNINFGEELGNPLDIGSYKVYCTYEYLYHFGDKVYSSIIQSNAIDIEILPSTNYPIYIPNKFYTLYTIMDPVTSQIRPTKLKEINMRNDGTNDFSNLNGKWSLSNVENGERELKLGDNDVKCTFTPNSGNMLPKDVDVVICAVEKELHIIVEDMVFKYGEPLELQYTNVFGELYPGDTIESLGIELFLTSRIDGHRISEDEVEPDGYYYIGGSIKSDNYKLVVETIDGYYNPLIIKAKVNVLRTEIELFINNAGTMYFVNPSGFPYQYRVTNYISHDSIPRDLVEQGESILSINNFNFEEYDRRNGEYTFVPSGNLTIKYKTKNDAVNSLAYLDANGWHKVTLKNGEVTFSAKNLKTVALFKGVPLVTTWPPIVTSVLLAISLGIMIVLLVKRFGGMKK